MNLTPQSFADCNSCEELKEMWKVLLDMLFDNEDMNEEYANELFMAYTAASLRLAKPQTGAFLEIPTYLIINEN